MSPPVRILHRIYPHGFAARGRMDKFPLPPVDPDMRIPSAVGAEENEVPRTRRAERDPSAVSVLLYRCTRDADAVLPVGIQSEPRTVESTRREPPHPVRHPYLTLCGAHNADSRRALTLRHLSGGKSPFVIVLWRNACDETRDESRTAHEEDFSGNVHRLVSVVSR